jgi:hypothetical protein
VTGTPGLSPEDLIGETFPSTLAQAGVVRVSVTTPPYPCLGRGPLRVVAVRPGPWVILCYQSYGRLPR